MMKHGASSVVAATLLLLMACSCFSKASKERRYSQVNRGSAIQASQCKSAVAEAHFTLDESASAFARHASEIERLLKEHAINTKSEAPKDMQLASPIISIPCSVSISTVVSAAALAGLPLVVRGDIAGECKTEKDSEAAEVATVDGKSIVTDIYRPTMFSAIGGWRAVREWSGLYSAKQDFRALSRALPFLANVRSRISLTPDANDRDERDENSTIVEVPWEFTFYEAGAPMAAIPSPLVWQGLAHEQKQRQGLTVREARIARVRTARFVEELMKRHTAGTKPPFTRSREYVYYNDESLPHINALFFSPGSSELGFGVNDLSYSGLWFGQPGAVAMLHYDVEHNWNIQLAGRKEWILVDPSHHADVRLAPRLSPNYRQSQTHAITSPLPCTHVILNPGDALYVPPFWLHQVSSLMGESVAVVASANFWSESAEQTASDPLYSVNLFAPFLHVPLKEAEIAEEYRSVVRQMLLSDITDRIGSNKSHVDNDVELSFGSRVLPARRHHLSRGDFVELGNVAIEFITAVVERALNRSRSASRQWISNIWQNRYAPVFNDNILMQGCPVPKLGLRRIPAESDLQKLIAIDSATASSFLVHIPRPIAELHLANWIEDVLDSCLPTELVSDTLRFCFSDNEPTRGSE